jgi:D-alanyl-D-alanine carboxypeptidase
MKQNAWKYGFVMSYPKGKFSKVCYEYEPWHYRYYGRSLAAEIHDSHQVPRRYLWNQFETAP